MKRLLMLALMLEVASAMARTETVKGVKWNYRIYGDGAHIADPAISTSTSGAITIPSKLGGKPVTGIDEYAFCECARLTRVTIPGSVKSIGDSAFYRCSGLTKVTISEGVRSIGTDAFEACEELVSVTIPGSVTNIGYGAFGGCYSLSSVAIRSGTASIGRRAFASCYRLKSFSVSSDNMNYKAESGLLLSKDGKMLVCGVCGDVAIPDGVECIGEFAFTGIGLTGVSIPNSVTNIGEEAFSNTSLKGVTIPGSVESIGYGAFRYLSVLSRRHSGLASVTISEGVKSIGGHAFGNCESLVSVTIPGSVTSIGNQAFAGCSMLESVTMKDGVKRIGEEAFVSCCSLTGVVLPKSVVKIGKHAFDSCYELARVKMPRIAVRPSVFHWCSPKLQIVYWGDKHLALRPNVSAHGTAKGSGYYEPGTNVTLKAKAKSGYVFAGWFADKACAKPLDPKGYDSRKPTVKYEMPAKNVAVYAKFVTKAAAKKSLKFTSATKKLAESAANATAGSAFSLALGIKSDTLPTVTAKGLPKGLKIDKVTGVITGNATKPGSYAATVVVTDAAGNTITQSVKIKVSVPSWGKGEFNGYASVPGGSSYTTAYLKFNVGSTGKVTGKVTHKEKGYSFSSAMSSCTASKAVFSPTVKIGSKTFKPGKVTIGMVKAGELSLVEASAADRAFTAQKKPGLVKKGKELAALAGWERTFTKEDDNSGLTKGNDRLVVRFGDDDDATVSGIVGGKDISALSCALNFAGKQENGDGSATYEIKVRVIASAVKYERSILFAVTVDAAGLVADVSAAFAE